MLSADDAHSGERNLARREGVKTAAAVAACGRGLAGRALAALCPAMQGGRSEGGSDLINLSLIKGFLGRCTSERSSCAVFIY